MEELPAEPEKFLPPIYEGGSTEREILEIVRELCLRLDIVHFVPGKVSWMPLRHVQCEFGLFGNDDVVLTRTLKDRLTPEELRPIIASSLVYSLKLSRERMFGLTIRLLSILTLLIFFVFSAAVAFSEMFSLPARVVAGALSLSFMILPVVLSVWLGARYRRKLWVKADRIAAEIVGRELVLHGLTKLRELGLPDLEKLEARGWRAQLAPTPRISQRIHSLNLQA